MVKTDFYPSGVKRTAVFIAPGKTLAACAAAQPERLELLSCTLVPPRWLPYLLGGQFWLQAATGPHVPNL